jgi:hypothetical protein
VASANTARNIDDTEESKAEDSQEVDPEETGGLSDNQLKAVNNAVFDAARKLNWASDDRFRELINEPELSEADLLVARLNVRDDLAALGSNGLGQQLGRSLAKSVEAVSKGIILAPTRLLGPTGRLIRGLDTAVSIGKGAAGLLDRAQATVSCSSAGCFARVTP